VRIPSLAQTEENVRIAMETLRVSKLRSGLTILGVVIGVATVMTMASLVEGLRSQIISTVEVAGPTTFYVLKAYSSTPVNPQNPPAWIRIRPDLRDAEAERIRRLPEVAYAGIWGQTLARVAYRGDRTQPVGLFGAASLTAGGSRARRCSLGRASSSYRRRSPADSSDGSSRSARRCSSVGGRWK
jgi:putative ABC transport system permease protein